jgi:hypothetical protein
MIRSVAKTKVLILNFMTHLAIQIPQLTATSMHEIVQETAVVHSLCIVQHRHQQLAQNELRLRFQKPEVLMCQVEGVLKGFLVRPIASLPHCVPSELPTSTKCMASAHKIAGQISITKILHFSTQGCAQRLSSCSRTWMSSSFMRSRGTFSGPLFLRSEPMLPDTI